MSCKKDEILLYVEGELAPEDAARVLAHAAGCPDCRALLAEEQALASALGGMRDLDCPEDFARTTVTRARCDLTHAVSSPRERRSAVVIAALLSAAAIFLLTPAGAFTPVLRALGPVPCIVRATVRGVSNSAVGALMIGQVLSRHFFESPGSVAGAFLLFGLLVALLVALLHGYHRRMGARGRGEAR